MSTLEEVQSLVAADQEKAAEAISLIEGTKAAVEETVSVYESVGAEGSAAQAASLIDQLEEAQATVQSAMSALEAVGAQAEALKTGNQSSGVSLDVTDAVTPADATAIPSEQWRNEVGKPLEAPEDLDDPREVNLGRASKLGRNIVRNGGNLKSQAEKTSSHTSSFQVEATYDPLDGASSHSLVETRPVPTSTSTTADAQVSDIVGTGFIVAAVVVEGASRLRERRKRRREEGR